MKVRDASGPYQSEQNVIMDERKYILFIRPLNFEFQYKAVGVVLRNSLCPTRDKDPFFCRINLYFPETSNE